MAAENVLQRAFRRFRFVQRGAGVRGDAADGPRPRAQCRSGPVRTGSRCSSPAPSRPSPSTHEPGTRHSRSNLRDGSGAVTLVWLGRRQISGHRSRAEDQGQRPDQLPGRPTPALQPALRTAAVDLVTDSSVPASGRIDRAEAEGGPAGHARRRLDPAAVPLRRGVRPLPAGAVARRRTRHDRVRAAVRCVHRSPGWSPASCTRRSARRLASRRSSGSIRLVQRQSLRYVLTAVIPTAIAAFVATRTGRAEDVFLPASSTTAHWRWCPCSPWWSAGRWSASSSAPPWAIRPVGSPTAGWSG